METITYMKLRTMVQEEGYLITWCGVMGTDDICVYTLKDNTKFKYRVILDARILRAPTNGVLRNGEADRPWTVVGPVPPNKDFFGPLRLASAMGVNVGGDCEPGAVRMRREVSGCVCGYDIEVDLKYQEHGSFPLPSAEILSIALWCTCGYEYFCTSLESSAHPKDGNSMGSESMVTSTIKAIIGHQPLWLAGWNCYSFDNTCMLYHASEAYREMFKQVK